MIKIIKGPEPQVLIDNKTAWTTELLTFLNRNPKPSKTEEEANKKQVAKRYGSIEVKDALRIECKKKCMYCESYVEATSDFHIEHIKPKAKGKHPELTYEYSNLGLCCTKCNRAKGAKYDAMKPFINPYVDDPSDHFEPTGSMIKHKSGDVRAQETEIKLDLNRSDLVLARARRFKEIKKMVMLLSYSNTVAERTALIDEILQEIDTDKEYSFWTRTYISGTKLNHC